MEDEVPVHSGSDTAAWNPTKRRRVEQDPGTGSMRKQSQCKELRAHTRRRPRNQPRTFLGGRAGRVSVGQGEVADSSHPPGPLGASLGGRELRAFLPQQGRHLPGTHMIVVVLDPGTDLQLRLGREVLVLAPQAALQLTLRNLVLVVVPAHVLRAREPLWFPAHARWLRPLGTETSWEVDIEDGSLSARRAEHHGVRPAEEEREAPRGGRRSPKGASATHVPGSSPSSLRWTSAVWGPGSALRSDLCLPPRVQGRRPEPAAWPFAGHPPRPADVSSDVIVPDRPRPSQELAHAIQERRAGAGTCSF
ncbi:proline-rich protein 23D1-like [Diceros bicornis minor]|uniref:proline-rich protein 23D1-like n=1 Tax=Diceros bicornis minor TaxID=77932 RepID=UPI0026E948A0|nr:proline-rich protein 23D1-like [Diceros bicornis minor]XP_058381434.1 proline-rich protein 23D1-like [Diceros bicornis minor]